MHDREYRVVRYSVVPRVDGGWVDTTTITNYKADEESARREAERGGRYLMEASVEVREVGPWRAEAPAPPQEGGSDGE